MKIVIEIKKPSLPEEYKAVSDLFEEIKKGTEKFTNVTSTELK